MPVEDEIHAAVVELVAPGATIDHVHPFRREPTPFPAELHLRSGTETRSCVVKTASPPERRLEHEAAGLNALAAVGVRAPRVLSAPRVVDTSAGPVEVLVLSRVPGEPLPWLDVTDVATADRTCRLLFDAIDSLHDVTPALVALGADAGIPRRTLDDERADAVSRRTPWASTPLMQRALAILDRQLPQYRRPLVFSNGDYNPLNVLVDHAGLTGWVDFEYSAFEDPLIGLPKFLFWADDSGWSLGAQVGLVERYLYRHRVTPAEFAVRVVLRGLTHLHDCSPDDPPKRMIGVMEHAIETLEVSG